MSTECPLCGALTVHAFAVGDRNRELSDERFHYRRCVSCHSLHLADVPAELGRYYPADYYGAPSLAQLDAGADGERSKLDLIGALAPSGRLVDVGAAFGLFARAADRAGYEVTAIERDGGCCEHLERVVGVRAVHSDAPERELASLEGVQAVTLWHVLEHLPRPRSVIDAAAAALAPGGALAIAMPNPQSLQFRVLRSRWAHVDAPRHLFLIPLAALGRFAAAAGLELRAATTSDPAGRYWNFFGWEHAVRWRPARRASTPATVRLAQALTLALSPVERRGLNGAAYTALFVKP